MNKVQNARRPRSRGQKRGKPGNGGNRNDHRVKGNPKQLIDKYKSLARDALQAGDRILAENYLQYADHYQRVWNERYGPPEPVAAEAAGDELDEFGMAAPTQRRSRSQRAAAAETAPTETPGAAPGSAPARAGDAQPALPAAAPSSAPESEDETATSAPPRPRRRRRPARSTEAAADLPSPGLAGE